MLLQSVLILRPQITDISLNSLEYEMKNTFTATIVGIFQHSIIEDVIYSQFGLSGAN